MILLSILLATGTISLISLIGIFIFSRYAENERMNSALISLSVGVFLGVIFLDILPESFEHTQNGLGPLFFLGGFLFFFVVSQTINLYHHHHTKVCNEECMSARMILIGDMLHNFVDGIAIASAFAINIPSGIALTLGVALHEVPQEISEFFVLLRGGYSKVRALIWSFFSAFTVILGGVFTFFFLAGSYALTGPLLAIAGGNLLYIATSDLLPGIFNRYNGSKNTLTVLLQHVSFIVLGIMIMLFLGQLHAHE